MQILFIKSQENFVHFFFSKLWLNRECVSMGAADAQTRRSLGHHLLHSQILRLLVLFKPADSEAQSSLL